jgi:uncharacterized protein (TIGR00369 family)
MNIQDQNTASATHNIENPYSEHSASQSSTNVALQFLQARIGQHNTDGPSAFGRWLHGKLLHAEEGSVTVEFTVRPEMTNPVKGFHGGVMAAIVDDVIGMTVFTLGSKSFYTSVNLILDFFAPAKEGDVITATTRIIKRGQQIVNAECELRLPSKQRLIAKGSSNLMKIATEIPA